MMRRVQVALLAMALVLALAPAQALAAEIRQGDMVVVGPDEIINDDLYVFGGTITVQGVVNGDVLAFGGNINVEGTVRGDLFSAGGTTTVSGPVDGSIRAAGGSVTVSGPVGEDLLVGSGSLGLSPSAVVGRDLLMGVGAASIAGQVERNVLAGGGDVTLNGPIGGDVRADVGTLRLGDSAVIGGNLRYTSENEATIAQGAVVRGTIERQAPEPERAERGPLARAGETALDWLRALVGLFVLGLVLVLLVPDFSRRTIGTLARSPWASLGLGFALLIGVPVLAVILFGLGLFVGGWWLALVLLALYGIALALSYVVAGLFVGRWILDRLNRAGLSLVWALLLGLALLLLVGLVPIVGSVVGVLAVLFGLGALVLALVRARQAPAAPAAS